MKSITITLSDEVARQMRIWAAEEETSMSQFLSRLLSERLERESEYRRAQQRFFARRPTVLQQDNLPYPDRNALHDRASLR